LRDGHQKTGKPARRRIVSTMFVNDNINTALLRAHIMAQSSCERGDSDVIVKNLPLIRGGHVNIPCPLRRRSQRDGLCFRLNDRRLTPAAAPPHTKWNAS
jgi:hypothetical protein